MAETEPQVERPSPKPRRRLRLKELNAAMGMVAVLLLAGYAWYAVNGAVWHFAVEADSEVVELELGDSLQSRWAVGGATICVPAEAISEAFMSVLQPASVGARLCNSRWVAGRIPDDDYVLLFRAPTNPPGKAVRPIGVRIEKLRGQPIAAIFSRPSSSTMQATVESLSGESSMTLNSRFMLVWDGGAEAATATSTSTPTLILPFEGVAHIGRDVAPAVSRVLQTGMVSVHSPPSPFGEPTLVAERRLMQGDRVSLSASQSGDGKASLPSGFVSTGHDPGDIIHVVAFGKAKQLEIHRLGAASVSFKPSFYVQFLHDDFIAFLVTLIALLGAFAGFLKTTAESEEGVKLEDTRIGSIFSRLWRK